MLAGDLFNDWFLIICSSVMKFRLHFPHSISWLTEYVNDMQWKFITDFSIPSDFISKAAAMLGIDYLWYIWILRVFHLLFFMYNEDQFIKIIYSTLCNIKDERSAYFKFVSIIFL